MKPPAHQRGAVLAMGLLILLVLTLVGVTAMKSTLLDERISSNNQFKMLSFQATESALAEVANFQTIEAFLTGTAAVGAATMPTRFAVNIDADGDGKDDYTTRATTSATDIGLLPFRGSSVGLGGAATVQMRVVHIEAVGTVEGSNAESKHNLGVGRVVPGASTQ